MSRRTVAILGVIFGILVGLVVLTRYLETRTALPTRPPVNLAVAEAEVTRVVIASQEGTITLFKGEGGWRFETGEAGSVAASASAGQVQALFNGLANARFQRLVARQPSKLDAYGLDSANARILALYAGETTRLAIRLGNVTEVPGEDYVQAIGDEAVWVVSGDLRAASEPRADLWRAKPSPARRPTGSPQTTAPATAPTEAAPGTRGTPGPP